MGDQKWQPEAMHARLRDMLAGYSTDEITAARCPDTEIEFSANRKPAKAVPAVRKALLLNCQRHPAEIFPAGARLSLDEARRRITTYCPQSKMPVDVLPDLTFNDSQPRVVLAPPATCRGDLSRSFGWIPRLHILRVPAI